MGRWIEVVRNFTPSWFSVNMGTGILGITIHSAAHQFHGQHTIATVIYLFNALLFTIFLGITIARYTLFPWVWGRMIRHSTQSLYIGTLPMGLATLVNATILVAVPAYGNWAVNLAWTMWWIDVVLTCCSVIGVTFLMFQIHEGTLLETMTAAWLLPTVPAVVAGASGALVASVLNVEEAQITLGVSVCLLAIGLGLSFLIIAAYIQRLFLYKLPNREVVVSAFLPLGPLGQGSFGVIQCGLVIKQLSEKGVSFTDVAGAGETSFLIAVVAGLVLWGFGIFWLAHGLSSVMFRVLQEKLAFNMGFWGFIFPLGVFTAATISLGTVLQSAFFAYLADAFVLVLSVLWIVVFGLTVRDVISGKIFVAPCLSDLVEQRNSVPA